MNAKQQAAADLRRLSHMLKGIIAIGDDLEAAGSLEQAATETQSRLLSLDAQETATKQRLADMEVTLSTAARTVATTLADANDRATEITADATSATKAVINAAHTEAKQIVGKAKGIAADLDGAITDRRNTLRDMNSEIASAQARLDSVNAELSIIRRKL